MKKVITMILAVIILCSIVACGGKETTNEIGGTWKIDYIEYEGSKFSVEEWENIEYENLSDFCIIFKDGGKAYIYDGDYGDLVDWLMSEDTIMIDGEKCTIVDGAICYDYYGDSLYLKKVSNSQEIPEEEAEDESDNTYDDYYEDWEDTTEIDSETESFDTEPPVTETPTTEASETKELENTYDWRQFLKDYEAWVDNYIAFMDKYNANPSDLTLLKDYAVMMTEYAEWSTKVDEMDDDLSDSEALEYAAELSRIAAKLADAAY